MRKAGKKWLVDIKLRVIQWNNRDNFPIIPLTTCPCNNKKIFRLTEFYCTNS